MTIVALATVSFSLFGQPNIDLLPDRTVFFYAKDAKAAATAVKDDPVISKKVEGLPPKCICSPKVSTAGASLSRNTA